MKKWGLPGRIETPNPLTETDQFYAERVISKKPIGLHWHNFIEMDYIDGGNGYQILNGLERPIAPGTLTVLSSSDFHYYRPDDASGFFSVFSFHLSEDFADDMNEFFAQLCGHQFDFADSETAVQLLSEFKLLFEEYFASRKEREKMVRNIIERIAITTCRASGGPGAGKERKTRIYPEILYIDKNFRQPLKQTETAQRFGFSPTYFSKIFKKRYGLTFQDYLLEKRLQWAHSLIRSTNIQITRICYEAGFNSHTYFCRCFKARYGVSPLEMRAGKTKSEFDISEAGKTP